eukprot:8363036-Alexandrium_andersonii.AAC.1
MHQGEKQHERSARSRAAVRKSGEMLRAKGSRPLPAAISKCSEGAEVADGGYPHPRRPARPHRG